MQSVYELYRALPVEKSLFCLTEVSDPEPYFCYPLGAVPIGVEGCILYCFLPEYGEMVFACDPESGSDSFVYPLAADFANFVRLLLACGTANPVEQIVWMDREQFELHLAQEQQRLTVRQKSALQLLGKTCGLAPMADPFAYVKALQQDFDDSRIAFSMEYYDLTGREPPETAAL